MARIETIEQRRAQALVGPADVAELQGRVQGMTLPGQVLDEAGQVVTTSAARAKAMFFAAAAPSGVFGAFMDWLRGQLL